MRMQPIAVTLPYLSFSGHATAVPHSNRVSTMQAQPAWGPWLPLRPTHLRYGDPYRCSRRHVTLFPDQFL